MEFKYEQREETLNIVLPSEIDHHSAKRVRSEADSWIAKMRPKLVVLDFVKVSFMDSSGIGLIIGRYKLVTPYGGRVVVENVSERIYKLLVMAGMKKLIEIRGGLYV